MRWFFPSLLLAVFSMVLLAPIESQTTSAQNKPAAPVVKGPDKELLASAKKEAAWLLEKHIEFAERFAKVKIYTGARLHAFRVLKEEPDHAKAREILGHRKVEGKWDKSKEIPFADADETKRIALARGTIGDDYDAFAADAAKRCGKLARAFTKAKAHQEAAAYWWCVLLYDANNAEAHAARGYKKQSDVWMPAVSQQEFLRAAIILSDANEGSLDKSEDAQANALELKFDRRKTTHFRVRTSLGKDRAKRVAKVAQAVTKYAQKLLDMKGTPVRKTPYTLTLVSAREDYSRIFLNYEPKNDKRRVTARNSQGSPTSNPYGYMTLQTRSALAGDDSVANAVALEVLMKRRSGAVSPWLITGFPYYVTATLFNTAITRRYEIVEKVGTRVYRRGREKVTRGNPFAPEDFRLIIRELVASGQDLPLLSLATLKLNEINEYHAAKAFSLFEYLFTTNRKAAQTWLKASDKRGEAEINALAKILKLTPEGLEAKWRAWVLKTY